MSDRMKVMKQIEQRHPKSYCPTCGAPNKCAIEMGKSASTCWCMTVEVTINPVKADRCLCKRCILEEEASCA